MTIDRLTAALANRYRISGLRPPSVYVEHWFTELKAKLEQ